MLTRSLQQEKMAFRSLLLVASAAVAGAQSPTSYGGFLGSTTTNGCVALSNCLPKYKPPAAGAWLSVAVAGLH